MSGPFLCCASDESENQRHRRIQSWKGYLVVIGGFLFTFSSVSIYIVGNTINYIESYLVNQVGLTVTHANTVWIGAITLATTGLFSLPAGLLASKVNSRIAALLATVTMMLGLFLTSLSVQYSLLLVVITLGFSAHIGYSLVYIVPTNCGIQWFPRHKGLVSGIILCGMGLGAVVFNELTSFYIDPLSISTLKEGIFDDPVILSNIPYLFLFLGEIMLPIQLLSICLLFSKETDSESSSASTPKPPDPSTPLKSNDANKNAVSIGDSKTAEAKNTDQISSNVTPTTSNDNNANHNNNTNNIELIEVQTKVLFSLKEFYVIWLIFCMDSVCYVTFTSIAKDMGLDYFEDDRFITTVDALCAVMSVLGRLCTGILSDCMSYKVLMMIECGLSLILLISLDYIARVHRLMYALWICGIYFLLGRTFIMTPVVASQAFGSKYFASNYGVLFTQFMVSSFISITLSETLLDPTSNHQWFNLQLSTGICTALAGVLASFIPRDPTVIRRRVYQPEVTESESSSDSDDY